MEVSAVLVVVTGQYQIRAPVTDINYNWMPISSSITSLAALLFVRYSYQRDIATSEILLPARYCYQRDIATSGILLPARYCYQRDIATGEILLPVRHCFRQYWQSVRYDCRWNMTTSEIWLPAGYSCLDDISYNLMPNSSDLTFTAILTASEIWLL